MKPPSPNTAQVLSTGASPHKRRSHVTGPCLDDNQLARLADGTMEGSELAALENHLDLCQDCAQLAAGFGRAALDSAIATGFGGDVVAPGDTIGRFKVRGFLGRGAMGQVVTAHDPTLGREIAIKLVSTQGQPHLEERLGVEAQTMAKLSAHRNVVTVYDVGLAAGRTFIAMEYVDGTSLDSYLHEHTELSWRERLSLFLEAGEGLVAAHEAGIVHRDFKPANVLIAGDGTVKVGDFGLAAKAPHPVAVAGTFAQASSAAGTPAYMSPEQHRGERATAASDQFGFAVAVWEALYGERPFAGDTAGGIEASVLSGMRRDAPRSDVPKAIEKILAKALEPDPHHRYPELCILLDRLRAYVKPPRAKRQVFALVGIGVFLVASVAYGFGGDEQAKRCPPMDAELARYWNPELRRDLVSNLAADDMPYTKAAAAEVSRRFDKYGDNWLKVRQSVCREAMIEKTQPIAFLEGRVHCLNRRLLEFDELRSLLGQDASLREGAIAAVAGLTRPEECVRSNENHSTEASGDLQAELAKAKARQLALDSEKALKIANAVLEQLPKSASRQRVDALLIQGQAYDYLKKTEEAEGSFKKAADMAGDLDDSTSLIRSWTHLGKLIGGNRKQPEAGKAWFAAAERELKRTQDTFLRAQLDFNRVSVLFVNELRDEALVAMERFQVDYRNLLADRPVFHAQTLELQSYIHSLTRGASAEAYKSMQSSIERSKVAFGPMHPLTLQREWALADVRFGMGEREVGVSQMESLLERFEAAVGSEGELYLDKAIKYARTAAIAGYHERATALLVGLEPQYKAGVLDDELSARYQEALGQAYMVGKETDKAIKACARADEHLAIATEGQVTPRTLVFAHCKPIAQYLGDYWDEAVVSFEEILRMADEAGFYRRSVVESALHYVAEIRSQQGRCDLALPVAERNLKLTEEALGSNHFDVTFPLMSMGHCLMQLDRHVEGVAALERALAIREGSDLDEMRLTDLRMLLARAYAKQGDKRSARHLARKVIKVFHTSGEHADAKELEAWARKPRWDVN